MLTVHGSSGCSGSDGNGHHGLAGSCVPRPCEAYFRFVTTPGAEPTNNLAEQALRFVVIDRRMTQGTRGEAGRQWCERFWTVRATCAQQGRSVFDSLHAAVTAHFAGQPAPSLLPA
ncbi:MAG: transposase [Phycisphaerae bacterium]|nr:transposase [Phycisphaerae bacterium]